MDLDKGYYQSPRWSTEITDCSMPLSFDTYSNCAHQCLYCFSFFQRAVGNSAKDYMHHRVKSVNVEKVKKIFTMDENLIGTAYEQFFPYVKNRFALQWGGLSDGFDWYEQKFRKSLDLLKFFCEINYPISISTKSAWFVDDPEYVEVLQGARNVHIKFSIITTDVQKAAVLEAGCATPDERFKAMGKTAELLGENRVTLRLRPYIIGVSDLCVEELFQRAADNGAFSVSQEFLCIEKRTTPNHHVRYAAISGECGYNLFKYYRAHSKSPGYMRLNYDLKRPYVAQMQELAEKYNLKLFISDAHHKEKSCDTGCCGLPNDGVLGNYARGHYAEAILIAKRNGFVSWDDIADKAAWTKQLPFRKAIGYNQGTTRTRAKRWYQSMYDFLLDTWNDTKSWGSPARYFGGALVPYELDDNGNVIYAYNRPFVEDGRRIESIDELTPERIDDE
jgi:DNA repair photolyase